jgi:mannose-6-phosphate isomerase-like protein (cupin superfamily)
MSDKPKPRPKCLKRGGRITPDDSKYIRGRVEIKRPGEETGAHVTEGKEEVIIVLEGAATVFYGKAKLRVRPGFAIFIGEGVLHNVRNEGRSRLRYAYVRSLSKGEGHHSH